MKGFIKLPIQSARLPLLPLGLLLLAILVSGRTTKADAVGSLASNSPAATIYTVTNSNNTTLNVEHCFTNSSGFQYTFWSQVPANSTATYHVEAMPQIPSPFQGTVTLYADAPFTARISGYDNASPTPMPTVSPTPSSGSNHVYIPYVTSGR